MLCENLHLLHNQLQLNSRTQTLLSFQTVSLLLAPVPPLYMTGYVQKWNEIKGFRINSALWFEYKRAIKKTRLASVHEQAQLS